MNVIKSINYSKEYLIKIGCEYSKAIRPVVQKVGRLNGGLNPFLVLSLNIGLLYIRRDVFIKTVFQLNMLNLSITTCSVLPSMLSQLEINLWL